MKKILTFLCLAFLANTSVAIDFYPDTVEIGDTVTVKWGAVNEELINADACTINVGSKGYSGISGNKSFSAEESIRASITCIRFDGHGGYVTHKDSANLTVTTPKPQISISFPDVVPQNGENTLHITAQYHNSCEVRIGISAFPKTFTDNDVTYIVKFTSQGNRNIDVECVGPSGTSFVRKEVYVGPPVGWGGFPPIFGGDDPVIEN